MAGRARRGTATWFWARHELRSRWRSLVVLGLLAGIAGGVAAAAVAGAARTDTAYSRFREATGAPTAVVFGTQVGSHDADYAAVKRLPAVADAGEFNLAPVGLKEYPEISSLSPSDAHLYRTLAAPLLVSGRLPNPRRVDEVLVNRPAAKKFGLHVGQRVTLVSAPNLDAFFGEPPRPGSPTVPARIVGIGNSSMDLLFGPDDPGFTPSGAFLERFGAKGWQVAQGRVAEAPNLVVRLKPGTDLAQFHQDVARVLHLHNDQGQPIAGQDIPIRDLAEDNKRVEHATDLERTGLLLFAAAVVLAGLMLVGQAITRVVFALGDSAPALRALGFVRGQLVVAMVMPMLVVAAIGAAVTIAVAVLLSPRFPVGLAGRLDPDRGAHFDAVTLLVGAAAVVVVTTAIAAVAALRATSRRPAAQYRRTSKLAEGVRAVAPPSIAIGTGLALERGRGDRSLPVRMAIIGGVTAVVGVVGSLGLLHGIDDALHEPDRSGQVWDATAFPYGPKGLRKIETVARREPAVTAIGVMKRTTLNVGGVGLPVYAVEPVKGDQPFTVLTGKVPSGTREVMLGTATAKALHRGTGDHITMVAGTHKPVRMTVVGTGLLPQEEHSSFDQGAWVSGVGFNTIVGSDLGALYERNDVRLVVRFSSSATQEAAMARLSKRSGVEVDPRIIPQDVLLLRNVRSLPKDLAIFLVLLGIAALGHALVTAVRRRRHDIAVLRTLGFTPRQAALCIAAQASTIGVISLAIGIPIGIIVGELTWRWVADVTPLLYVAPIALVAVLLVIPATVIGANVLAAWPANRASRIRPADVLRTDAPA